LKESELNKKVLKEIVAAENQLNALKGINTSVLSLKDALAKLGEALGVKKKAETLIERTKEAKEISDKKTSIMSKPKKRKSNLKMR